jgi:hypothetical protein
LKNLTIRLVDPDLINIQFLIKEFLAALLRGKKRERSELPFEFRACSGVHTFDWTPYTIYQLKHSHGMAS